MSFIYKTTNSPWGEIQHRTTLAEGIVAVSTAGHGGIWLSPERRLQLPKGARQIASTYCQKPAWWEEDCEAMVPLYVFFDDIAPQARPVDDKATIAKWLSDPSFAYLNFPKEAA